MIEEVKAESMSDENATRGCSCKCKDNCSPVGSVGASETEGIDVANTHGVVF